MRTLISKLVDIRSDDELKGLLWGTTYGFFIMFSYYILRAVRDEIAADDRGNLYVADISAKAVIGFFGLTHVAVGSLAIGIAFFVTVAQVVAYIVDTRHEIPVQAA